MRVLIVADSLSLPRPHRINSFNPEVDKEMAVHYDETYGYLLEQELSKSYPDESVHVINRGQRFYTIKNIYQQLADHLFFFQPDVLVIQVGIVDCWFRGNLGGKQMVPISEFEQTYEAMIQLFKQRPETKVIFIGICPTSDKLAARYPGIATEIINYNLVLQNKVDNNQIFYIDMELYVKKDNPQVYLLPDDGHLNKQGNVLIKSLLQTIIEAFMESYAGAMLFNSSNNDKKSSLKRFIRSFEIYPYNIDNIYNLLGLAYELEQFEWLDAVVQFIVDNKIRNADLTGLLTLIKGNMQK